MRRIANRLLGLLLCAASTTAAVAADEIKLKSGEVLKGQIVGRTVAGVQLKHDLFGTLTIPTDQIAQTLEDEIIAEPPPEDPEKVAAKKAEMEAAKVAAANAAELKAAELEKLKQENFFAGWKSRFELGFSGSEGNSDVSNIYSAFVSTKTTKADRWKYDAKYFYSESDGVTQKNQFTTGLLKDWLFPESPWFIFAEGRFDADEFRDYDQRLSFNVGLGYDLYNEDSFKLTLRGGAGGAKEFGSEDESFRPEARFGGEMSWKITERQELTAETTYYPDLEDTAEFRWVSSAAWVYKLNENGLSLKLGLENEYESQVDPGRENNDLKYFGSIVFEF